MSWQHWQHPPRRPRPFFASPAAGPRPWPRSRARPPASPLSNSRGKCYLVDTKNLPNSVCGYVSYVGLTSRGHKSITQMKTGLIRV